MCNIKFFHIVYRYIIWINWTNYLSIYIRNIIYENTIEWHYIWILSTFNPIAYCSIVWFISSYFWHNTRSITIHAEFGNHIWHVYALKWTRTIPNRDDRILICDFVNNRNWWNWINIEYLLFNYYKIEYSILKIIQVI